MTVAVWSEVTRFNIAAGDDIAPGMRWPAPRQVPPAANVAA